MTIYEIKEKTREKEPYFFDKKTLKFFDQTMKSFKVRTSPAGNIYIFAPRKFGGFTFRQFADGDLKHVHMLGVVTLLDIEKYIKEH